jgi:hypothetical protein
MSPRSPPGGVPIILSTKEKAHPPCLLADMVQRNTLLQTITLSEGDYDLQIYTKEIHPFLVANQ